MDATMLTIEIDVKRRAKRVSKIVEVVLAALLIGVVALCWANNTIWKIRDIHQPTAAEKVSPVISKAEAINWLTVEGLH